MERKKEKILDKIRKRERGEEREEKKKEKAAAPSIARTQELRNRNGERRTENDRKTVTVALSR